MNRPVVWLGRALALLGLAVFAFAVLHGKSWALLAGLAGFVCASGLGLAPLLRSWVSASPATRPSDFSHLLDLLRRTYGARAGWAVGLQHGDLEVTDRDAVTPQILRRGAAMAQLASVDGRAHIAREDDGTYVTVGDFPFGAGVLLAAPDADAVTTAAVSEELRRFVAAMRIAEPEGRAERADHVVKRLASMAGGAQTLEGVAKAGAEIAEQLTGRGVAIVVQDSGLTPVLHVLAVSKSADQRLLRLAIPEDSTAGRAVRSSLQVVTHGKEDVFGAALPDRRRRERAGTAFPLQDGHMAIGTLVVLGGPLEIDQEQSDQLYRLVPELGSRLAAARAVHEAEQRATRDPLTGLRNRRELEQRLSRRGDGATRGSASLIYLDLDHFKALNDTLGHAAGDAALRHVARLLEAAVRERDLAARIGGEEFAIWMPDTPLALAFDAAERIRGAIATTVWRWNGTAYPLAVSCGVAGYPESVEDVNNLRAAADAALYRAKTAGRDRVEKASRGG